MFIALHKVKKFTEIKDGGEVQTMDFLFHLNSLLTSFLGSLLENVKRQKTYLAH